MKAFAIILAIIAITVGVTTGLKQRTSLQQDFQRITIMNDKLLAEREENIQTNLTLSEVIGIQKATISVLHESIRLLQDKLDACEQGEAL